MRLIPMLEEALDAILRRAAFFAEPHSIKGLLAIQRLARLPGFSANDARAALGWKQVLDAPEVSGLISEHVIWPAADLADGRLKGAIEGAVFPMAYLAGAEWVRRRGFMDLLESFADRAIERVGYLGHSWTIWCSFLEIAPWLQGPEQEVLAAERFVEFCASQLSDPDWTPAYHIERDLQPLQMAETEAIEAILTRPGFYGHRVITLSYLFEYRERLSDAQWQHGLKRMCDASQKIWGSAAHDLEVHPSGNDRGTIERAVVSYVNAAAAEVHTLTLADSIYRLWPHLGPAHKAHLFDVLDTYAAWKARV